MTQNRTQTAGRPNRVINSNYCVQKPTTADRNFRGNVNRTAINFSPSNDHNNILRNSFTPNKAASNRRKPDFIVGNIMYPDNLYQRDIVSINTASTMKS